MELKNEKLYCTDADGNMFRLGKISSVELTPENNETDDGVVERLSGSFLIKVSISRKQVYRMAGISNNWLKYHGFPKWRGRYEKD